MTDKKQFPNQNDIDKNGENSHLKKPDEQNGLQGPILFENPFNGNDSGKDSDKSKLFGGKAPNKRQRTSIITVLIGVVVFAFVLTQFFNLTNAQEVDELSTSEFVQAVEQGRIQNAVYSAGEYSVTGTYYPVVKPGESARSAMDEALSVLDGYAVEQGISALGTEAQEPKTQKNGESRKYHATYVGSDSLQELMQIHNVSYQTKLPNGILDTLISFLPMLVFVGLMIFFFNQMAKANNSQMSFGKARAKKTTEERPDVRFSDVAGEDEAVEELQEIKDFLMDPEKYQRLGAKIPRGCLLVGPPGTGKTLLARAVAGEASVPFFSISGSEFVEMFVGVGASRVRSLFEQAKEAAPAIIFIDEIDAVGRQRGAGLGGGHDEREQTLNQLLVEMDGFDKDSTVVLLAATNRVDVLDPALLRPGRFDRQVIVDAPDVKGREKILGVHAKNKPIGPDVDLRRISQLTSGMTGADLMNLMNEAALLTARRNKDVIGMDEVNEAMERLMAGPERKTRVLDEKTRETIAYHESGHALVGYLLEHTDPIHKITIVPRGMALGYTMSVPDEDKFLVSRSAMIDDLAMFMGGRVAEEIFCGDITTGASNDLERATKQARKMVVTYGMSEALGQQTFGEPNHEVFLGRDYGNTQDYSPETAQRIDEEVARLMKDAHDTAYRILSEHKDQMHLMAKVLLERETVDGDACQALLAGTWDEYLKIEGNDESEEDVQPSQDSEGAGQ
ncbi:MAG: ATP-dependent zinc metalloprotease FtsH, partial [Eggerthellaceae bacterium]|nr:ATP-dependent zinc metalloprotease FtsH [Eggerthellaceae bacterium]